MKVQTPMGEIEADHIKSDKCEQVCFFCYYGFHRCVNPKECKCKEKKP